MLTAESLAETGIDAVALKPSECDPARGHDVPLDAVVVDYEGRDHLPDPAELRDLAEGNRVRLTTPVRADGFDPLGDDGTARRLPAEVGRVLVAGNAAYLDAAEAARAIAPRLRAARERWPNAWVGTEGVERLALAAGGTQFELLSRHTAREVRALRAAGFDGGLALYAPTVPSADEDVVLDAVGDYVARRRPVAQALPADARTDAGAAGRTREVLLDAAEDYALLGPPASVRERVTALKEAGVDTVVAYPAAGVETFC